MASRLQDVIQRGTAALKPLATAVAPGTLYYTQIPQLRGVMVCMVSIVTLELHLPSQDCFHSLIDGAHTTRLD
jgi:hypothetical protein